MNWDLLHHKLVRAARRHPPGDQVPYAFEKRVLTGLVPAMLPTMRDDWSAIARALWWAAGACSAIALALSVWTHAPDRAGQSFAEDLEQTILASVDEGLEPDLDLPW